MRSIFRIILLIAVCSLPMAAFAQHSVSLAWGASPDAAGNPSLTYNVYRASGICPNGSPVGFTKVASAVNALSYTDSSVGAGSYCYYVTAQLAGAESVPSNMVVAAILPLPPGSLVVSKAQ